MPIVVRLRHEMFTRSVSAERLAATAAIHELVLVGVHQVVPAEGISRLRQVLAPRRMVVVLVDGGTPAWGRALIEELLNDGVIPVVLTGCDPLPVDLTSWLSTVCQDAAPAVPSGDATKPAAWRTIDALSERFNDRYRHGMDQTRVGTAPPLVALHRLTESAFKIKAVGAADRSGLGALGGRP